MSRRHIVAALVAVALVAAAVALVAQPAGTNTPIPCAAEAAFLADMDVVMRIEVRAPKREYTDEYQVWQKEQTALFIQGRKAKEQLDQHRQTEPDLESRFLDDGGVFRAWKERQTMREQLLPSLALHLFNKCAADVLSGDEEPVWPTVF